MEEQHETEEERISRLKRWGEIPLDKEALLKHFGYDPRVYINTCFGMWPSEKVYREFPTLESYEDLTGNGKIRVVLDFDPNFPRALFRIERIPKD